MATDEEGGDRRAHQWEARARQRRSAKAEGPSGRVWMGRAGQGPKDADPGADRDWAREVRVYAGQGPRRQARVVTAPRLRRDRQGPGTLGGTRR